MSSAIDLPELQKKFDEYKKYTENRREEVKKEFWKKLHDEIENNELFQKMENLFWKFKEKGREEVDNMYEKMINLDKCTINLFEEKMGKFEENELIFFLDHFGCATQKYIVFVSAINHGLEECSSYKHLVGGGIFSCYFYREMSLSVTYEKIIKYYYNDKANNYFRDLLGNDDIFKKAESLRYSMYSFSEKGCDIISKKIEYLFNNIKRNIPSGWKISSKYGYFRIEPQGEKMKEIELPIGKSTIFMEGIYQNINESLELNAQNKKLNIENKGNITQDNLKEIYEDAFNMIMNKIVENKLYEKKEVTNSINKEMINFVKKIENETEGFANIKSKKISNILSDLNNNQQLNSVQDSEINKILISNITNCQEEIMELIKEEIKVSVNKIKPQFILLLDISEKMDNFIENFVRKIIYQVLLKLNLKKVIKFKFILLIQKILLILLAL